MIYVLLVTDTMPSWRHIYVLVWLPTESILFLLLVYAASFMAIINHRIKHVYCFMCGPKKNDKTRIETIFHTALAIN